MKAVMMNELESALVEWVSKNDKHGRGFIGDVFTNKGYHFDDIEHSMDRLLETNVLTLVEGYVTFEWPEDVAYEKNVQHVLSEVMGSHGGFSPQIAGQYIPGQYIPGMPASEVPVLTADQNPAVHSPSHYTRGGIEVIDFIEAKGLNFHLGNVVKYVSRAGFKQDAKIQDLEKALWYLNREIKRIKTQEP